MTKRMPQQTCSYVGSTTNAIYKLDAGAPSALPSLLNSLTLQGSDGTVIFGLVVDPVTGYGEGSLHCRARVPVTGRAHPTLSLPTATNNVGYAGTASGSYSVIKFSLGAGTGA